MAGRTILVQSTLNSIPNYHMQYFKIPQKILHSINKIQRDFIWGSSQRKKKIHYLNWKTITTPKQLGGLGLRDVISKNKAILSGLAWRMFTNPTSLWEKYLYHHNNFRKNRTHTSFTWKNAMIGWKYCAKGFRWLIATCKSINIWDFNWIPPSTNLRSLIQGPIPLLDRHKTVADLRAKNQWNLDTCSFNFWNQLSIPTPLTNNIHSNIDWLLDLKNLNHTFVNQSLRREMFFPFAIWHIWLNRNNNIFHNSNRSISIPMVISRTLKYVFTDTSLSSRHSDKIMVYVCWNPPPHGHYKLNIDGSFSSQTLVGGLGGVIRDEYGNWKMGLHQKHHSFNATSMEILALLRGIELAYHHNLIPLAIETDSTENPPINHNFREGNKVVHHLANEARTTSTNSNFVIFCTRPTGVTSSLAADVAGHISTKQVSLAACINLAKLGNYNVPTVSAT
ncbi:hypothetical protein KY290_025033 [Solanum tuberosum]|uniref:RNase H type-1 domain-containing protein n=1 Tax=Solanum tuberosum TaxID=4113 RepID=A0ABQ7UUF3_SOLTU|nr:hypothetical protein KY284_023887 [Solanum tuberosum]KAH0754763.1 hypothetical protein KY290_025033 [Solanum tuberosum]